MVIKRKKLGAGGAIGGSIGALAGSFIPIPGVGTAVGTALGTAAGNYLENQIVGGKQESPLVTTNNNINSREDKSLDFNPYENSFAGGGNLNNTNNMFGNNNNIDYKAKYEELLRSMQSQKMAFGGDMNKMAFGGEGDGFEKIGNLPGGTTTSRGGVNYNVSDDTKDNYDIGNIYQMNNEGNTANYEEYKRRQMPSYKQSNEYVEDKAVLQNMDRIDNGIALPVEERRGVEQVKPQQNNGIRTIVDRNGRERKVKTGANGEIYMQGRNGKWRRKRATEIYTTTLANDKGDFGDNLYGEKNTGTPINDDDPRNIRYDEVYNSLTTPKEHFTQDGYEYRLYQPDSEGAEPRYLKREIGKKKFKYIDQFAMDKALAANKRTNKKG